jgi:polysaccharide deacetylase 2 family uncharacterized protein YibQ
MQRLSHRHRSLVFSLTILAFLSIAGLDYIRWRKGGDAWMFGTRTAGTPDSAPVSAPGGLTPSEIVLTQSRALGIPAESLSQYRDSEGIHHMMLEVTPEQYESLELLLDKEFVQSEIQATKERRRQEQGKTYYLWRIKDKDNQLLSLLVSSRSAVPEEAAAARPSQTAKNKVAIIIDDMGNSLNAIETVCRLQRAITIAILPYSHLAHETATIARQNNLEVILHLPLESLYNEYDNKHTAGIIHSGMSAQEVVSSVAESLGQVPFIDGVNTHMGSKITSDPNLIRVVLEQLKNRGLYFIDSRTTAQSVAFDEAQRMGIPSAFRNVFLDSEINESFIRNQLLALFRYAQQNGMAVGICHPSPETLKVLRENVNRVDDYGLELVFASEVLQVPSNPAPTLPPNKE